MNPLSPEQMTDEQLLTELGKVGSQTPAPKDPTTMSDEELLKAINAPSSVPGALAGEGSLRSQQPEIDTTTGLQDMGLRAKMSFLSPQEQASLLQREGYQDVNVYPGNQVVFRNPATGKLTAVEEEGFTRQDIADWAGYAPEIVGGTAGSLVASPVPVPGARVAGAGLGTAAGRAIREGIGRSFAPEREPWTGKEAAQELGVAGMAGAAGEIGGKIINRAVSPLSRRMTEPARRAMGQLKKRGGTLSPAQATGSRPMHFIENAIEGSFTGGERMAKFKAKNLDVGQRVIDDIVNSLDNHQSLLTVGNIIQDAIGESKQIQKNAVDMAYRAVDDLAGEVTVPTQQIKLGAQQLLAQQQKHATIGLGHTKTIGVLENILKLPDEITFSDAVAHRSALLRAARKNVAAPTEEVGAGKLLSKFFDAAIDRAGGSLAGDAKVAFREASKLYKSHVDDFYNKLIRKIGESDPERVADLFLKGSRAKGPMPTAVGRVMSVVDEATKSKIRGHYLSRLLTEEAVGQDGRVSGKGLLSLLNRLQPETQGQLITGPNLFRLKKAANTLQHLQEAPSGVGGGMLIQLTQAGALVSMATGSALDQPGMLKAGAAVLFAPSVMARIMTSQAGIRWLTEGLVTRTGTKEAVRLMARLGALTAKGELLEQ